MNEEHRRVANEVADVKLELLAMSGEVEDALQRAIAALLNSDVAQAHRVIAGDRGIDRMEVDIEEKCIELLARQQPLAGDLRMITAAMRIAHDLERVGDHAVNIAESAERLPEPRGVSPVAELAEMSSRARAMLADAINAFVRRDPTLGRDVRSRDDYVDLLNRSICQILITQMTQAPHLISAGMEFFLVSRNLERVADLATNIAEDVVFLIEGKSIRHHSP